MIMVTDFIFIEWIFTKGSSHKGRQKGGLFCQVKASPCQHRSQQFVGFNGLLCAGNRLDKVIHIEVSPYQFGNLWGLLCVIFCNLLQSIIGTSWRTVGYEDMSSILIHLNGFNLPAVLSLVGTSLQCQQ